ncbi:MAG: hypothetical protein PVG49_19885, partial [Desulfobacteraceae bacterium]
MRGKKNGSTAAVAEQGAGNGMVEDPGGRMASLAAAPYKPLARVLPADGFGPGTRFFQEGMPVLRKTRFPDRTKGLEKELKVQGASVVVVGLGRSG